MAAAVLAVTLAVAGPSPVCVDATDRLTVWEAEHLGFGGIPVDRVDRLVELAEVAYEACEPPPEVLAVVVVRDTTYRGIGSDAERWRPLVAEYFPADQVDTALCVVGWESGGNPDAKNPRSSARGLFQVLAALWAPHFGISADALYDPVVNVRVASQIWGSQGWGAWSARKRGIC